MFMDNITNCRAQKAPLKLLKRPLNGSPGEQPNLLVRHFILFYFIFFFFFTCYIK